MAVKKLLTREDIERAMKMTRSNRAAARYLHVSYPHYRKYAKLFKDEKTGETLFEIHKNPSGKGIPKYLASDKSKAPIMDLIEGKVPIEHFDPKRIKERIIAEALVEEKCGCCGFAERRTYDTKIPLVLHHKDRNKKNFRLENLQFLCYNCSFLYAASPITDEQVHAMEDYVDTRAKEFDWELDDYMVEHLKSIGLSQDSKDKPGDEFVDYM